MAVLEPKKRFDRNREELHAIAREFAQKVKDNPYVWGVVAKPYGAYMHLMTLIDWQIPRELVMSIYDAELEIADKYDGQLLIEFDTIDCLSPDRIDEAAYDDPGNIIYRKGGKDAERENSPDASGAK
ncbi:hypothetical protein FJZ31_39685 [Candidatus Poribacteria bacterium]|nr:hypothetical protein [Candidatus Poribacteria bacterium]